MITLWQSHTWQRKMPQIGQIGFPFGKSSGFSQFFPICPTCFFPGKHLHFLGDFQLPWLMFQPVESIYSTSSSHFAGCAGANRARAARAPMGIDVMHRSVSVQTWMCPERGYGLSRYTQRKMWHVWWTICFVQWNLDTFWSFSIAMESQRSEPWMNHTIYIIIYICLLLSTEINLPTVIYNWVDISVISYLFYAVHHYTRKIDFRYQSILRFHENQ